MPPHCSTLVLQLAVLSLFLVGAASAGGSKPRLIDGGWEEIENINDFNVKRAAEFAVSEISEQSHKKLVLENVVEGENQVVGGMNYRLVIAVKDESTSAVKNYKCSVYKKLYVDDGPEFKLKSFGEILSPPRMAEDDYVLVISRFSWLLVLIAVCIIGFFLLSVLYFHVAKANHRRIHRGSNFC